LIKLYLRFFELKMRLVDFFLAKFSLRRKKILNEPTKLGILSRNHPEFKKTTGTTDTLRVFLQKR
ncbi:MAG: hypothetical protein OXT67_11870, partial [Zetaproteobacteria bacterium]|nr:hypothetical protein [Zetaproteobacteria bacterium]